MARRIKTFEEACKAQNIDPVKVLPDLSMLPVEDQKAVMALVKLCIIQRSLNGKWKPDWSDGQQLKYYPIYWVVAKEDSPSGFGLSYDDFGYDFSSSSLGARLYYKDNATAEYAFRQFQELYEDLVLIPK